LECKSSEKNSEAQEEVTVDVMIPKIKKFNTWVYHVRKQRYRWGHWLRDMRLRWQIRSHTSRLLCYKKILGYRRDV